jgi:hypothetical protein
MSSNHHTYSTALNHTLDAVFHRGITACDCLSPRACGKCIQNDHRGNVLAGIIILVELAEVVEISLKIQVVMKMFQKVNEYFYYFTNTPMLEVLNRKVNFIINELESSRIKEKYFQTEVENTIRTFHHLYSESKKDYS